MKRTAMAVLACAAMACSEARTVADPDAAVAADAMTWDDAASASDVGSNDVGGAADRPWVADVPAASGRVVINEVRATGEDWVELYNPGATAVSLQGMGLTDSESSDGTTPRVADKLVFPAGTTLGPGEYLLVVADVSMPSEGVQTACLADAGPSRCLHAGFGISGSRGESVHLLDAMDRPVESVAYPPDGDGGVPAGATWARLPNGAGAFTRGAPTPGQENRGP